VTRSCLLPCVLIASVALVGCPDDSVAEDPYAVSDAVGDPGTADVAPDVAVEVSLPDVAAPVEPPPWPTAWELIYDPTAPPGVAAAAQDAKDVLEQWGFTVAVVADETSSDKTDCLSRTGRLIFAGEGVSQPKFASETVTSRSWSVREQRCDRGTALTLSGGGSLGRQVAVFRALEGLGVRWFHPQVTFVPDTPVWSSTAMSADGDGRVPWRTYDGRNDASATLQWQLANGVTAFDADDPATAARELPAWLAVSATTTTLEAQVTEAQPALVILDLPSDVVTATADLAAAAETVRLASPASEIVVKLWVDDVTTVGTDPWFAAIAGAPVNVGVLLLFRDVSRYRGAAAAPLREWFNAQAAYRAIHYGVGQDTSWTNRFMVGMAGRGGMRLADLQLWDAWANVAPGGWTGVHLSNIAHHEWWSWSEAAMLLRAGADGGLAAAGHYVHLSAPMGVDAGAAVQQVLAEAAVLADDELVDAGGQPSVALASNIDTEAFIGAIPRWDLDALDTWTTATLPRLDRVLAAHDSWLERLSQVANGVPADGMAWFGELFDTLETATRWTQLARDTTHSVALRREAYLRFDEAKTAAAEALVAELPAQTLALSAVVERRVDAYHCCVPNDFDDWSDFVAYFEGLGREAAERAMLPPVTIVDVVLAPAEELVADVTAEGAAGFAFDFGDDTSGPAAMSAAHSYTDPGVYDVVATGDIDGQPTTYATRIVQTSQAHTTGLSGHVVEPPGVDLIDVAFPALTLGKVADGQWILGFSREDTGLVGPDRWVMLPCTESAETLTCSSPSVLVPAVNAFSGEGWLGSLEMLGAQIEVTWATGQLAFTAEVIIGSIVVLAQDIFGFEEQAAIDTIAGVLGVDPATMPAQMPFLGTYQIQGLAPPAP